jgi:hypothetical protein
VGVIYKEMDEFFAPDGDLIGYSRAGRLWNFVSKFVMLDRFAKALELTKVFPAPLFPKKTLSSDYLGTGSKVGMNLTDISSSNLSFVTLGAGRAQPSNEIGWKILENMGRT